MGAGQPTMLASSAPHRSSEYRDSVFQELTLYFELRPINVSRARNASAASASRPHRESQWSRFLQLFGNSKSESSTAIHCASVKEWLRRNSRISLKRTYSSPLSSQSGVDPMMRAAISCENIRL